MNLSTKFFTNVKKIAGKLWFQQAIHFVFVSILYALITKHTSVSSGIYEEIFIKDMIFLMALAIGFFIVLFLTISKNKGKEALIYKLNLFQTVSFAGAMTHTITALTAIGISNSASLILLVFGTLLLLVAWGSVISLSTKLAENFGMNFKNALLYVMVSVLVLSSITFLINPF